MVHPPPPDLVLIKDRPLVLLLGWLGCDPRHLRRYEKLYSGQGQHHQFNVVSRIATPWMVVATSTQLLYESPSPSASALQPLLSELMDLIDQCPAGVLIHAFSNGGVFVWEQLCLYRFTDPERQSKCLGVIFDSSPAYYAGQQRNLERALEYCTWRERMQIRWRSWLRMGANKERSKEEHDERALQFWNRLENDPWNLRQLYLGSQDDPLADCGMLQQLIHARQRRFGKHRVWKRIWESSPHCCHMLKHPVEYRETVKAFLDACLFDDDSGGKGQIQLSKF